MSLRFTQGYGCGTPFGVGGVWELFKLLCSFFKKRFYFTKSKQRRV